MPRRSAAREMRSRMSRGHRRTVPRCARGKGPDQGRRWPSNVRYTENGQRLRWATASGTRSPARGTYKLHVADRPPARSSPSRRCARRQADDHRGAAQGRWQSAHHRGRDHRRAQRGRRQESRGDGAAARGVLRADAASRPRVARGTGARRQHVFQRHAVERRQGQVSVRRRLPSDRERRPHDQCARGGRPAAARSEDGEQLLGHVDVPRAVRVGPAALRQPHPRSPLRGRGRGARRCRRRSRSSITMPARRARSRRPTAAR